MYIMIFLVVFGGIIVATDNYKFYTAVSFGLGAFTSLISGYIGMMVATQANVRVTFQAATYVDEAQALKHAFNTAFRGGCVMGFCLVSLALSVLTAIMYFYQEMLKPHDMESYTIMFEYICGYGLGGSSVALFCRVGGGIYTKAADVGADLIGKNEMGFDEDSPKNPATIADNVGDNVGDIAGMGADLFGSFAESTVAALVVSGTSKELLHGANYFYPLIISATGIFVCFITSFVALHIMTVTTKEKIEVTLKWQLIISSILLTPAIYYISIYCLPETITFVNGSEKLDTPNWGLIVCCLSGLWSGLIIGYFTDYFTSNAHE
jgi:H+-translocating diphosphatase